MRVITKHGLEELDEHQINKALQEACEGLPKANWAEIASRCKVNWYEGITTNEISESTIMAGKSLIEQHPEYDYATARLLLRKIYKDVNPLGRQQLALNGILEDRVVDIIRHLALDSNRDKLFKYQGIKILYDRYLLRDHSGQLCETPQLFFARVAAGVALAEKPEDQLFYAQKFYDMLSTFKYMPSTPTLFNAGTTHPQMASCYVTHVDDSLEDIFKTYGEIAQMSKWAGGIGTNWTSVRGTGGNIKGTNGQSSGVIPWLKIQNDIAIAVNQGGKRRGSHCAYLEPWHIDFEEFLDLRKAVGDDRRRTHDLNTAAWVPDIFMERVENNGIWTMFCPNEAPLLTETWGPEFNEAYENYESGYESRLVSGKQIMAKTLWKKMLGSLYETGHPWITFKDTCNRANPLSKEGMIRSSNLCTEITLNTGADETAVCNLGSVNLQAHITVIHEHDHSDVHMDFGALQTTTQLAVRMLDNIIDIMFYPTEEAAKTNKRDRPIGLGVMGTSAMFETLRMPFDLDRAGKVVKMAHGLIYEWSHEASTKLAEERGAFESQPNSEAWYEGKPMRNSYVTAIAPTATISNIVGTSPSIEPNFSNLFVISNLSGDFTVVNERLIHRLETLGLWDTQMLQELKLNNGSVQNIDRVPHDVKEVFKTAFEIDQNVLVNMAAIRQKYIDQSQSLNLYVADPSGQALSDLYFNAWKSGVKTTYYLRTLSASRPEQNTVGEDIKQCKIDDSECESCT